MADEIERTRINIDALRGERVEFSVNEPGDTASADAELSSDEVAAQRDRENVEAIVGFLSTANGIDLANRIVGLAERIQASASANAAVRSRFEKVIQLMIIIGVIVASSTLAILGKFEVSIGVLFGTLVGYVFGKKA